MHSKPQNSLLKAPAITRRGAMLLGLGLAGCQRPAAGMPTPGTFRSLRELQGIDLAASQRRPPAAEPAWTGDPLTPLRRSLTELQRRQRQEPVSIIQFGDSHTVSPAFVPRLRELFQERYGAVGPGRLAPGTGPRFTRPALVQVEQQGGWTGASALRSNAQGPFSIAAYKLRGEGAGSRIALRSTESGGFDTFRMEVLVQPGGGRFRMMVDGEVGPPMPTAAPTPRAVPLSYTPTRRHHQVTIELLGDGPVDILGWGVERRGPGVLVEGFGLNGATIDMLSNIDQDLLRYALAERRPKLLILAFGTNEAVGPRTTEDSYAAQLTERVRAMKRMAPSAGILLLGAPDAARRGGTACGGWSPLPALAEVRAAQRRVARAENVGLWDWSSITPGACGLHAATRANPPLVQGDHIHFTTDGYRLTAQRLFAYLAGSGPMA